jgi:hypothetical protein
LNQKGKKKSKKRYRLQRESWVEKRKKKKEGRRRRRRRRRRRKKKKEEGRRRRRRRKKKKKKKKEEEEEEGRRRRRRRRRDLGGLDWTGLLEVAGGGKNSGQRLETGRNFTRGGIGGCLVPDCILVRDFPSVLAGTERNIQH